MKMIKDTSSFFDDKRPKEERLGLAVTWGVMDNINGSPLPWERRLAAIMFRMNGISRKSTWMCGAMVSVLHTTDMDKVRLGTGR